MKKGITLVELIIAMTIFSILISIPFTMIVNSGRFASATMTEQSIKFHYMNLLDFITDEIQYSENSIVITGIPATFDVNKKYIYTKENGMVYITENGVEKEFPNQDDLECDLIFEADSNGKITATVKRREVKDHEYKIEVSPFILAGKGYITTATTGDVLVIQ